jgi:hypothetical protein
MGRFSVGLAVGGLVVWLGTPGPASITDYQVVTRTETVEVVEADVPTPFADSLVDWDRVEAETDCLWEFLQRHGIELTLSNVLTAGDWVDMHGGACAMMEGEDDAGMEG